MRKMSRSRQRIPSARTRKYQRTIISDDQCRNRPAEPPTEATSSWRRCGAYAERRRILRQGVPQQPDRRWPPTGRLSADQEGVSSRAGHPSLWEPRQRRLAEAGNTAIAPQLREGKRSGTPQPASTTMTFGRITWQCRGASAASSRSQAVPSRQVPMMAPPEPANLAGHARPAGPAAPSRPVPGRCGRSSAAGRSWRSSVAPGVRHRVPKIACRASSVSCAEAAHGLDHGRLALLEAGAEVVVKHLGRLAHVGRVGDVQAAAAAPDRAARTARTAGRRPAPCDPWAKSMKTTPS